MSWSYLANGARYGGNKYIDSGYNDKILQHDLYIIVGYIEAMYQDIINFPGYNRYQMRGEDYFAEEVKKLIGVIHIEIYPQNNKIIIPLNHGYCNICYNCDSGYKTKNTELRLCCDLNIHNDAIQNISNLVKEKII